MPQTQLNYGRFQMANPNRAKIGRSRNPKTARIKVTRLEVTGKDLLKEGMVKKVLRKDERFPFTSTKLIRGKVTWDLHGVEQSERRTRQLVTDLNARGLKTGVATTKDGFAVYAR